jgi:general secretion pathway protein D
MMRSDARTRGPKRRSRWLLAATLVTCLAAASALAQPAKPPAKGPDDDLVQLDFDNAEITAVIDMIARLTNTNFIYDDRVRGRVTIVSPTPIPIDQAYAVFESVLHVKGFTTVPTPGGALKVIPLREAKETTIDTVSSTGRPPNRDHFVTRLIPLRYIEAGPIVTTLKPLVSKDASIAAYEPTNTVILTEAASNIRRLIGILESIDVDAYREELAVIKIEYADVGTLADQITQIFAAEATKGAAAPSSSAARRARSSRSSRGGGASGSVAGAAGGKVRIITDDRTNSLIVLANRTQLEEVRALVRKLDVPVTGGGRIHVYYLLHADAEELTQTLTGLVSGGGAAPAAGQSGQATAIRTAIAGLAEGVRVTADPATNSLVIQATQEGFNALSAVIAKLDVERPQVLVEALIMEVDITDAEELGFNGLFRIVSGDTEFMISTATDVATTALLGGIPAIEPGVIPAIPFLGNVLQEDGNTTIQAILRAAASDAGTNIISSPHILTSDNEEAEIRVGDNIPIVTSRLDAATGAPTVSTSVNIERQDIGVTLRVTPQISEGDLVRLDIFQEITAVNLALTAVTSLSAPDSGVALSSRRVENTVVVSDGDTVVIGGLIGEDYQDTVNKVPFLGDIPVFGWLFKTTERTLTKKNLLIFLTPHIVRSRDELENETIRKREEFMASSRDGLNLSDRERAEDQKLRREAEERGETYRDGRGVNPVRHALLDHTDRYPVERMLAIERAQQEEREQRERAASGPQARYVIQAGVYRDEEEAVEMLTELVDAGHEGTLLSGETDEVMLYEIRLGPYDNLDDAQWVREVLRRSHQLAPTVLIQQPEQP